MNEQGPAAPTLSRMEALERRLAEQEHALDELYAEVTMLVGKIGAILDLLARRAAP